MMRLKLSELLGLIVLKRPNFLYHGSKQKIDVLLPQQAYGLPEENGNRFGIYAYADFDMARRFALPIKPFSNGSLSVTFEERTGRIILSAGHIDKNSYGYVYKINSDSFIQLDEYQWLSLEPVIPVETTIVYTADLWSMIVFEGKAKEYLREND
jgi:hypothetical protein